MSDNFENKNKQNENQENIRNQKVKLRLRLKSGEEFEAEGSLPFVLAQKNEFLSQNAPHLNKASNTAEQTLPPAETLPKTVITPQNIISAPQNKDENTILEDANTTPQQINSSRVTAEDFRLSIPAIRRRQIEGGRLIPDNNANISATNDGQNWKIDGKIWSKVAYLDGTDIVLRRKVKDLKPGIAALITLAAAKMLAGITKMTALELSKSLKMSGYLKPTERLDRIIAPEIKAGTLFFEGTKRRREYMISQTGTAKAYTSAEHFLL